MNQGNLNVLTGTTSGKSKKIHHHTTAGGHIISYMPGHQKILFTTILKNSHHNKIRVPKKMAAEVENIEVDFNLDEHTEIDVLLLKIQ